MNDDSGFENTHGNITRQFPFTFALEALAGGQQFYTPNVGDILKDAWVQIDTAFNGTTPIFDFGYADSNTGFWAATGVSGIQLATIDTVSPSTHFKHSLNLSSTLQNSGGINTGPVVPGHFLDASPLFMWFSVNGIKGGGNGGTTVGSGVLYLETATPI